MYLVPKSEALSPLKICARRSRSMSSYRTVVPRFRIFLSPTSLPLPTASVGPCTVKNRACDRTGRPVIEGDLNLLQGFASEAAHYALASDMPGDINEYMSRSLAFHHDQAGGFAGVMPSARGPGRRPSTLGETPSATSHSPKHGRT